MHGEKFECHDMTLFYPNSCFKEVCDKGTMLCLSYNMVIKRSVYFDLNLVYYKWASFHLIFC